jgi:hypothetical protein
MDFGPIARVAVLVSGFLLPYTTSHTQQSSQGPECGGLHAGIEAWTSSSKSGDTESVISVEINFALVNDSNVSINVHEGTWKIVVDGKELNNNFHPLFDGKQADGDAAPLAPGEFYHFSAALDVSKYFPETRQYHISWKGDQFQSSTVLVAVGLASGQ